MGRRRKGRDVTGWVIVDKPAGLGSTDVVTRVRRALGARKAGHAGTLDPSATGILAVALGEATKTVPFIEAALKEYVFTLRFGAATDTDDAEGAVIATSEARPSDDALRDALPAFRGDILQVPPRVSAVRVEGRRAYDLAREGAAPELKARALHVAELELLSRPDADTAELRMVCGKGGYVRAIARDLGLALGTRAHVLRLRRTWSGPFDLDRAITLETLETAADPDALLLPLEIALGDLPSASVGAEAAQRLAHGNEAPVLATDAAYGDTAWARHQGRAVAIGTYRAGRLHPSRVFAASRP